MLAGMGNREDLPAGALACLKDKGWARTTVRDIAAAAGVNHAAIGYHFGSREALLTSAFVQAMEEWGAEIEPP
jgi:AcrR family transcriptional regulator